MNKVAPVAVSCDIEEDIKMQSLEKELKRVTKLSELLGDSLARRTD